MAIRSFRGFLVGFGILAATMASAFASAHAVGYDPGTASASEPPGYEIVAIYTMARDLIAAVPEKCRDCRKARGIHYHDAEFIRANQPGAAWRTSADTHPLPLVPRSIE